MVYRYSWLAGIAALLLAFAGLNQLLRPTVSGPPWQPVVLAGLVLGIAITWAALSFRLHIALAVALNVLAMIVAAARIAAPDTTSFLLPTGGTVTEVGGQLSRAFSLIRNGLEPVIPLSGIVVILMVVMWAAGILLAWGLLRGHPYVALIPPLVMVLQFATMDRAPTSVGRILLFLLLVAATLLAITVDQRDQTTGRMVRRGGWHPTTQSRLGGSAVVLIGLTVVGSLIGVTSFRSAVPRDGVIDWRGRTGLTGSFYGSVSYNPFIGIRQSLVRNTDTPLFRARITGDLPADRVYFQLVTMETYGNNQFYAQRPEVVPLTEQPWQLAGYQFGGETVTVVTDIVIDRLEQDWIPEAYAPVDVIAERTLLETLRVRRDDAALRLEGGLTLPGMSYTVESEIPVLDPAFFASTADGQLAPSFQEAQEAAEPVPQPAVGSGRVTPPDVDRFLQLPDDLDPALADLARDRTANLETAFEKGIALEAWFHSSAFRYSIDIEPGHGAEELDAWLLDENSPNFHTGYCENFATAMAVLARMVDVPSRVVLGFTPGEPDPDNPGVVVVRDRNAHAWVELWIPGVGWVRFDPTPRGDGANPTTYSDLASALGFDLTDYLDVPDPSFIPTLPGQARRPDQFDEGDDAPISAGDLASDSSGLDLPGWLTVTLPAALVIALVVFSVPGLKWFRKRRRLRRLADGDITAAWEELVARLTDLGHPPNATLTPNELAAAVDPAMRPLASVYGRALYGPDGGVNPAHVATARDSFDRTAAVLTSRFGPGQRFLAWYRPGSLRTRHDAGTRSR
ncbi:MAG: DUF4129 domain-containing transglutaminase family protein [Acidimicrobiia bacterium]|jgi:transglutaminase-like putative cysteine protease